jgi:hypothetical protein
MIKIEQNKNEIIRRFKKYVFHSILIVILLIYLPNNKLHNKDITALTLSLSIVFSLLDICCPSIYYINK